MMMMSKRVCFSPEASKVAGHDQKETKKNNNNKRVKTIKVWMLKLPKGSRISVGGFFKNIGDKMARALPPRNSCKVSSSASLGRSRSYAETLDSQRAEAIEDCIEFFNSSSSLHRSNSLSSSSC